MNVHLTPELEQMVQNKVRTGRYNSASEVMREALRLMEERDQIKADMRRKITAGRESLRQGKGIDGDVFFDQLEAEMEEEIRAEDEKKEPARARTTMKRFILSPEAATDIKEIRAYLKREAGERIAISTVKKIKESIVFLSRTPGAGHFREDLTDDTVKFWPIYSYLIAYDPNLRPIEILRVLHGNREISEILSQDG